MSNPHWHVILSLWSQKPFFRQEGGGGVLQDRHWKPLASITFFVLWALQCFPRGKEEDTSNVKQCISELSPEEPVYAQFSSTFYLSYVNKINSVPSGPNGNITAWNHHRLKPSTPSMGWPSTGTSSCLKWRGGGSLVTGKDHLGEPDKGVPLHRGPEQADLPDSLLAVVLGQEVGLIHTLTLRAGQGRTESGCFLIGQL